MSDTEASFTSIDSDSASDYISAQKAAVTKAIPNKAANSKASAKPRKATVPRTDSVTINKVERAKSVADSDYKVPMAPEGGAPALAPIFNTTPRKVGKKKTWIYDDTTDSLIEKDIQFIPSFFKIFDEVLVNTADNKIQNPIMSKIKVTIDPEQNLILVYNNGSGIPVEIHKEGKVYIPKLIFGHLLTLSNYDDSEKKVVSGHNGTEFIVETANKELGKKYYQKFINNMSIIRPPKITKLGRGFQMSHLNANIVGLLKWQVYMFATMRGVSVFLNDSKLKLNNFKDYIQMYLKSAPGPDEEDLTERLVF
ncbi:DNA topoisomerase 2 [Massospora cicadina]|nr:DNA topoisomerase 2 [Massospora cicadina]